MKNTTLRFIIVLVALLFLNIEAAQAGLVHKIRVFVTHEFPNNHIELWLLGLAVVGFLLYVVFSPVEIGREKWSWIKLFTFQAGAKSYQKKRQSVNRIAEILNSGTQGNSAHF